MLRVWGGWVCADGAGTKSSLAYMYWKETGDLSVWRGIAQDSIIMNIDDLICVGATDNILVSSTIGRNKNLIPGEVSHPRKLRASVSCVAGERAAERRHLSGPREDGPTHPADTSIPNLADALTLLPGAQVLSALINGTEEVLTNLRINGVNCISTGGETADIGDLVRTVVVDSTVTCRMKRSDVISNSNIRPGDVIVGLSSSGQATYEVRAMQRPHPPRTHPSSWTVLTGTATEKLRIERLRISGDRSRGRFATPNFLSSIVARTEDYTHAAKSWALCLVQGPFSVAPCQTLPLRFATVSSLNAGAGLQTEYNGGMGSNGLTSARHDVLSHEYAAKFPEAFDPAVPEELVFSGKYKLQDVEAETGLEVGKLVLSPTRTYAPIVKALLDTLRGDIHGMVHCSGGAQTKVLHFVKGVHVIKDQLFPCPPLFRIIQEQSDTDWKVRKQLRGGEAICRQS
jgi:hypothetical protein